MQCGCAWFIVHDGILELATDYDGEPDVLISGSLLTLARMSGESGMQALRDGSLELTGDAHKAERFQRLLAFAKPDIEEEISGIVGDLAAHRLGEIARGLGEWGRNARTTMSDNVREYLQEESRDVPSRYEMERFTSDVGRLRDDVDRLEARINMLRSDD